MFFFKKNCPLNQPGFFHVPLPFSDIPMNGNDTFSLFIPGGLSREFLFPEYLFRRSLLLSGLKFPEIAFRQAQNLLVDDGKAHPVQHLSDEPELMKHLLR